MIRGYIEQIFCTGSETTTLCPRLSISIPSPQDHPLPENPLRIKPRIHGYLKMLKSKKIQDPVFVLTAKN